MNDKRKEDKITKNKWSPLLPSHINPGLNMASLLRDVYEKNKKCPTTCVVLLEIEIKRNKYRENYEEERHWPYVEMIVS